MREEHRLRVLDSRILRKAFGPKRDYVLGSGEDCTMRIFMFCTPHQILFG